MRRSIRSHCPLLAGVALLGILGLGFAAPKEKEDAAEAIARLEPGLTPEQVRERVGPPRRVARQILSHRYLEQWVYDAPSPARLQFECRRGQKPRLVDKPLLPARGGNQP
jgi:hypothetical protein